MKHKLPEIPVTWLVAFLFVTLIGLRYMNYDTWVTATISILIGYLTGVKLEQIRKKS